MCRICCGPTTGGYAHCFACCTLIAQLQTPLATVLPAQFCPVPSPLYRMLIGYKESAVAEVRVHFGALVTESLVNFAVDHQVCILDGLGGPIDVMLPVPSTVRPPPNPMEQALGFAGAHGVLTGRTGMLPYQLLRRTAVPVGHMRANADAFEVSPDQASKVDGARVLLIDDTYVSGARSQSAAAALRRAGARDVLIVPLGRVIRPDKSEAHARFAERYVNRQPADRCPRCLR